VTNGSCTLLARPRSILRHDGSETPFAGSGVANTQDTFESSNVVTGSSCPASDFEVLTRPKAKEGTVQGLIMTLRGVESLTAEQVHFEWAPAYVAHANQQLLDLDSVSHVEPYFVQSNFPGTVTVYFLHTLSYRSSSIETEDTVVNDAMDTLFSTAAQVQEFLGLLRQNGVLFEAVRSLAFPTRQQDLLEGSLTLKGIPDSKLTQEEIDTIQSLLQDYIFNYYIQEQTDDDATTVVTSVNATVQVTNREELTGGDSRRQLQFQGEEEEDSVTIIYDMVISFRTIDDNLNAVLVAAKPFTTSTSTFSKSLQTAGVGAGGARFQTIFQAVKGFFPTAPSPLPTDMPTTSMPTLDPNLGDSAMSFGGTTTLAFLLFLISSSSSIVGYGFLL
jgi:hypothetical protein